MFMSYIFIPFTSQELDIEEHDIDILEHGVNYKQHVSYNKVNNILTIFVPQHLDIDSSTTKIHQPSVKENFKMFKIIVFEYTIRL